jgi:hypothetical protein
MRRNTWATRLVRGQIACCDQDDYRCWVRPLGTVAVLIAMVSIAGGAEPQPRPCPVPGQGIEAALFKLAEMDMHVHSGMERQVPLDRWIDLAVADGRKVMVLLDHRELYDRTAAEYAAAAAKARIPQWYPVGQAGKRAFIEDVARAKKRSNVLLFAGWEIYEGELDEKLDREAMVLAEVIGWHISPNGPTAPCGVSMVKRVRQIAAAQKEFPVPMIVFHPFSMRIERVQRDAKKQGKQPADLTVQNYRFFQPGEQEILAGLLAGSSIYVELSRALDACWNDPVVREALVADIRPLAEMGVQFTVSTDNHSLAHAKMPFQPNRFCDALGVTPRNTNTIVRELLALRTRGALTTANKSAQ